RRHRAEAGHLEVRPGPEDPRFKTDSERKVWETLRDTLRPDDTLIASFRLTDTSKDHEADLIVIMPEVGVVIVEVKGAGTALEDGQWSIMRGRYRKEMDPVGQAR